MTNTPTDTVIDAWIGLFRIPANTLSQVEKSLKNQGFPAMSWYDVLWELDRCEEAGLRPFELKERLLFTQYGLSRLLDKMVNAGYVLRQQCEADGRGQLIVLTEDGRALRRTMWPAYAKAIQQTIGDKLSEQECQQLSLLLNKIHQP